jgi:hypothetical protein
MEAINSKVGGGNAKPRHSQGLVAQVLFTPMEKNYVS